MTRKKILLNKLFLIGIAIGCLFGFVLLTDPYRISLPLIMVPFILLGFVLYQLASVVMLLMRPEKKTLIKKIIPLSVSFLGICILLLASLHQLTWKDSFLVGGFTLLFWLYILRADFLQKQR